MNGLGLLALVGLGIVVYWIYIHTDRAGNDQ